MTTYNVPALYRIVDKAAASLVAVPYGPPPDGPSLVEYRQAAQAVRATLETLAEALTYREADGTATGWRTISGEQLAALAACIRDDDASITGPSRVLDEDATVITCRNAQLKV